MNDKEIFFILKTGVKFLKKEVNGEFRKSKILNYIETINFLLDHEIDPNKLKTKLIGKK